MQHCTVPYVQEDDNDGAAQERDDNDDDQRDDAGFPFDSQIESQETALLEVWMATFGEGTAGEAYALRKALGSSSSRSAESPGTGDIRGGISVDSDGRNMTTKEIPTIEVRRSLRDFSPTLDIAYSRSQKSTVKSGEAGVVSK